MNDSRINNSTHNTTPPSTNNTTNPNPNNPADVTALESANAASNVDADADPFVTNNRDNSSDTANNTVVSATTVAVPNADTGNCTNAARTISAGLACHNPSTTANNKKTSINTNVTLVTVANSAWFAGPVHQPVVNDTDADWSK